MVLPSQKQIIKSQDVIGLLLEDGLSYGKIGKAFGLNQGMIWYFYNDNIIPKSKVAQRKLGLEEDSEIIISIRKRRKDGTFARGKSNAN